MATQYPSSHYPVQSYANYPQQPQYHSVQQPDAQYTPASSDYYQGTYAPPPQQAPESLASYGSGKYMPETATYSQQSSPYARSSSYTQETAASAPPQSQYVPPPPPSPQSQYVPPPTPSPQSQYVPPPTPSQYAPSPRYATGMQGGTTTYSQEPPAPTAGYTSTYSQEPAYEPASTYTLPPVDTSYSPRAPSLPATSYDYTAASTMPYYSSAAPNGSDYPAASSYYGSTAPTKETPASYYGPEYRPNSVGSTTETPASTKPYYSPVAPDYDTGFVDGRWEYELPLPDNAGATTRTSYQQSSYVGEGGAVYAYDGGNSQPYGARGTGRSSSDSFRSGSDSFNMRKIAKALPKVETESTNGGIQRYHVKVVKDSSGLPQNVVCQIGLDGVRLLDPKNTTKTLRIYPLETITKWEVESPSIFTFFAKSSVDFEQRKTSLQSSSSTTNAILDTLTAVCLQLCEMVGEASNKTSTATTNPTDEQKKGTFDWFKAKPAVQEEKDHWVPDDAAIECKNCSSGFGPFLRRHHCRNCGDIFCDRCTKGRIALTNEEGAQPVRVCDHCLAEVTHRTTNATPVSNNTKFVSQQQTHEDLAKKLQEEMQRNAARQAAAETENKSKEKSGSSGSGISILNCSSCGATSVATGSRCPSCGAESGKGSSTTKSSRKGSRKTRDVACPICTVHLEVEVPASGSETVECGVCQHPFLVRA